MNQNNYSMQWSSKNPGLQIYLLDQSHSMGEKYPEHGTKAMFAAVAINRCIREVIEANSDGSNVKDRAKIIIIGYGGKGGDSVEVMREGMLSQYADNPIRLVKAKRMVAGMDRGMTEIVEDTPVYIEGVARGSTAMGSAFHLAYEEIQKFLAEHPQSPAPILINVTDGCPWSYEREHKEEEYAIKEAQRIMSIETPDGTPLLFNAHIGTGSQPYTCPAYGTVLRGRGPQFLSKISPIIPDAYKAVASKLGIRLEENALGFVSDASPAIFNMFIAFGSSGAMRDRMSA